MRVMLKNGFFGAPLMQMGMRAEDSIPTMGVDGRHLYYNAKWVLDLKGDELQGVLVHEVLHICYLHHTRRGDRDPELWNVSGDAVINLDVKAAGFQLPPGVNTPGGMIQIPDAAGKSCEQVYNMLKKQGFKPAPGPDPGGCGGVMDAAKPHQVVALGEAERQAQQMIRGAMAVARGRNAGNIPSALVRMMAELDKPKTSWGDTFRAWADEGRSYDTDWCRPSRRDLGNGFILPSTVSIAPAHIVAWVDTSGSMSQEALSAIMAELQGMLDEHVCDKLTIGYCDTRVQGTEECEPGDIIKSVPRPGGGTDFAPAMEWTRQNVERPSGVVYLTDLECHSFGFSPGCPVLWVRYGSYGNNPPYGRVLEIDPSA
jgi:predicted metal-dependent peptidase